ncbi:hypothetical protein VTO42DRAFT_3046 [Malbranchea cinnamomea]
MSTRQSASPSPPPARGTTTEPNTPEPSPPTVPLGLFAKLIPMNAPARAAMEATMAMKPEEAEYHQQFIREIIFNEKRTYCFELSLAQLPQFAHLGWRIGRGRHYPDKRKTLEHYGVDLLLGAKEEDEVAGIHARFNWVKGAGGFFIIADNKRGKKVMLNGEFFSNDRRIIPHRNTIMLGECIFTLEYVKRTPEEEEQFQFELATFYRKFHREENPLILPTPSESDASFGDWVVQYAISRGSFGVVYMVTHARSGRPAAAKQILKSNRNKVSVEREIKMAERISRLNHPRIASPFEIRHQRSRTKIEVARVRALLDDSWEPASFNNILGEYIILSPLLSGTFRSLYQSKVSEDDRAIFFSQLLDAVAFLHEQGICHRDIKPDNILVKRYDPPDSMLTDFGCASDQEEIMYDAPGTIPYLAPEQFEGQTHGRAVDYWACALVGVELMGGPETTGKIRVLPGKQLGQYRSWLAESKSPMAKPCREMLVLEPSQRMTAKEALKLLNKLLEEREKDSSDVRPSTAKRRKAGD